MKFERRFTRVGNDPFVGIEFAPRESKIVNPDGTVVFQAKITAPKHWSQTAIDIIAQKYMRKAGVPQVSRREPEEGVPHFLWRSVPCEGTAFGGEGDARQVFCRLAGCWAYHGWKGGYFGEDEESARAFYDELLHCLAWQKASPNSPQWFNSGLAWAYGLKGPACGYWRVDPATEECRQTGNAYEFPTMMACFIQGVEDDLVNPGGIMDLWGKEAKIFKMGSGAGINVSALRGTGEPLSGGGKSSGLEGWLRIGDSTAAAIKSGGTVRRAARMVVLDIDHPDIEWFIGWKVQEEDKVAALVAGSRILQRHADAFFKAWKDAGFAATEKHSTVAMALKAARADGVPVAFVQRLLGLARDGHDHVSVEPFDVAYEGEAYRTVSGQNANNSVRVTNAFMRAVEEGKDWSLYWRTELVKAKVEGREPKAWKTLPARELWDKINQASWACADPGLQWHCTINDWHTCPSLGEINATNPCAEFNWIDNSSCNLASLNLLAFYRDGVFDTEGFAYACRLWAFVLEVTVYAAQFPSEAVARNTFLTRTLGLGYANLGALLMTMGLPYDSPAGRQVAACVSALLHFAAARQSAALARAVGPFAAYAENRGACLRVFGNHRAALRGELHDGDGIPPVPVDQRDMRNRDAYLFDAAVREADACLEEIQSNGLRNAQISNIAPTGTIALVMDCDSTGAEPDFSLVKFKKLAGGGYFRLVNQSVGPALLALGYSDAQACDVIDYVQGKGTLTGCPYLSPLPSGRLLGLAAEAVQRIEVALKGAFDLRMAFNPANAGREACLAVGITEAELADPKFDLLTRLGLTPAQIEEANLYTCGAGTVEGAPHLKAEHLPVFDCANRCGKTGKRFIAPDGHVLMLGAIQPFVSGGISKTVNVPLESTVSDFKRLNLLLWKQGVKCGALYRDGSKMNQPLSSGWEDAPSQAEKVVALATALATRAVRRRLPSRRKGITQKARIAGHPLYVRTGEYPDGSLGEIFLDFHKEGEAFRSIAHAFAIAISLGLQHGVPLEEFVDAYCGMRFEPQGVVEGHDRIKLTSSIVDYLFRELGITYLGRNDLANAGGEESPYTSLGGNEIGHLHALPNGETNDKALAMSKGFTGDPCSQCGQLTLVRSGTCLTCRHCGATSGC